MKNLILAVFCVIFVGCFQPKTSSDKAIRFLGSDGLSTLKFIPNPNAPSYPKIKDKIGFVAILDRVSPLYFMGNDGNFPLSIAVFSSNLAIDMQDPSSLDFIKKQNNIEFYEFGLANIKNIKFSSKNGLCNEFENGNLKAISTLNFYIDDNEFVSFVFDIKFDKSGARLMDFKEQIYANNQEKATKFIVNFKDKIIKNELLNTEQILKNILCYQGK